MRIRHKRSLVVAVLAGASFAVSAEHYPYERYQSIVDRQMFGEPPPGFDPTRPPSEVQKGSDVKAEVELTKEQEQIKSAVHFSVINIAEDGTPMVGFTDNSDAKLPKHYFLRLGETRDGWLVKEADPEAKSMTIVKNEIEVELSLGDNSGSGGGKTARAGAGTSAASSASLARPRGPLFGGGGLGGSSQSLRGRRQLLMQQREAELQAMKDERKKLEEERRAADEKKLLDEEARAAEREEVRKELRAIMEAQEKIRVEKEQAKKEAEEASAADGE